MKLHCRPSIAVVLLMTFILLLAPFAGCGAAQSETKGLEQLRALTRNGRPDENAVAKLEKDYPSTKLAGLARLLRARLRMNAGDWAGATQLLEDKVVTRTDLAEYTLLWRAKSLANAGRRQEAAALYDDYVDDYADSHLARDATIVQAENLLANGQYAQAQQAVKELAAKNDGSALAVIAQAYEKNNDPANAATAYRNLYLKAPKHEVAMAWAAKQTSLPVPSSPAEWLGFAQGYYNAKSFKEAADAFAKAAAQTELDTEQLFQRGFAAAGQKRAVEAANAFSAVQDDRRPEGLYFAAQTYAQARLWAQANTPLAELRRAYPKDNWTIRALVNTGNIAFDAKSYATAQGYYSAALAIAPKRGATAAAHFGLGWMAHEQKNYAEAARLLTEHLADYADKNTDFRGRAAYWAARDSERSGKPAEAVALYRAMLVRYDAHWYGQQARFRLTALGNPTAQEFPADSVTGRAVANLQIVNVAAETAGSDATDRLIKADQLDIIGEKDLALSELDQVARKYPTSLKINLALVKIYRPRQQNLLALNALKRVYPDYAQMKPEEMTRAEWDAFYPLNYWDSISEWAKKRNLDVHQVAGLIRQESVCEPRAKSAANAYGLMQLLIPTARSVARRYGNNAEINEAALYQPALNIELGTGYMRDMYDKFGRLEYMAAAYNAGPGRVPGWRATLPAEMDEWVEAIPFKETRGYVQGVVRNTLQYRRLYDANGQFKAEVGRDAAKRGESVIERRLEEE